MAKIRCMSICSIDVRPSTRKADAYVIILAPIRPMAEWSSCLLKTTQDFSISHREILMSGSLNTMPELHLNDVTSAKRSITN